MCMQTYCYTGTHSRTSTIRLKGRDGRNLRFPMPFCDSHRVDCLVEAPENAFCPMHRASSDHRATFSPLIRIETPVRRAPHTARHDISALHDDKTRVRNCPASVRSVSASVRRGSAFLRKSCASMRKYDEALRNASAGMRSSAASSRNYIAAVRDLSARECAGAEPEAISLNGFATAKGASSSRPDREERWTESQERRRARPRSAPRKRERSEDVQKIEKQRPFEPERR